MPIFISITFLAIKEEKLRGRPGYEHLNDPLHILIEAELPANVIETRLRHAQEVIEELLKPEVSSSQKIPFIHMYTKALLDIDQTISILIAI